MIMNRLRVTIVVLTAGSATIAFAQIASFQPGQWEMTSTTTSVDMPSAPPQIARMMAGRSTTIRHCITAQDTATGGRELIKAKKSCVFDHYVMSGGKFDAAMTCSEGGGTMTAATTGTYTATTMASTSRIMMKTPAPMTITTSVVGKRVGAC